MAAAHSISFCTLQAVIFFLFLFQIYKLTKVNFFGTLKWKLKKKCAHVDRMNNTANLKSVLKFLKTYK